MYCPLEYIMPLIAKNLLFERGGSHVIMKKKSCDNYFYLEICWVKSNTISFKN